MEQLDKKDRRILYALDTNARQPDSHIADDVGLSREAVSYRIDRLQEKGIIKSFVTILNHKALGYQGYRIFFKFRDLTPSKIGEIVEHLKGNVAWLVRVRGNWSFNSMLFAKRPQAVEGFLQEFKQAFRSRFNKSQFSLITRILHYRRGYLLHDDKDTSEYDVMGKDVSAYDPDETDMAILETIENEARLTSVEISRRIDASERVVRYRLRQLQEQNVILGFRSLLDIGALGHSYFKIHAKLNQYQGTILNELNTYLHHNPYIVYKTETLGGPDLELEVQARDNRHLYTIWDALVQTFPGLIEDYEIMDYEQEYKLSYLNTVEST